jgi:hypothetical protein
MVRHFEKLRGQSTHFSRARLHFAAAFRSLAALLGLRLEMWDFTYAHESFAARGSREYVS